MLLQYSRTRSWLIRQSLLLRRRFMMMLMSLQNKMWRMQNVLGKSKFPLTRFDWWQPCRVYVRPWLAGKSWDSHSHMMFCRRRALPVHDSLSSNLSIAFQMINRFQSYLLYWRLIIMPTHHQFGRSGVYKKSRGLAPARMTLTTYGLVNQHTNILCSLLDQRV